MLSGVPQKFKYKDSPECPTCSGLEENAEHVFFACSRFNGRTSLRDGSDAGAEHQARNTG